MEVYIKHPKVEPTTHFTDAVLPSPKNPEGIPPQEYSTAGNVLGFVGIDTDTWDFDNKPVEFYEEQPTKAAEKWVAQYEAEHAPPVEEKPLAATWGAGNSTGNATQ